MPGHSKNRKGKSHTVASDFHAFTATMRLPLAPVWASSASTVVEAQGSAGQGQDNSSGGMEGVRQVLAGWVMRYLPPLQSVLLSFDPAPTFLHPISSFSAAASPFSALPQRNPAHLLLSPGPEDEADAEETEDGAVKRVNFKGVPLIAGSGFALAQVQWQGYGWRPRVGQHLSGSPTLSTPSHISLLLHNLFNASIPASHIPTDQYHFDPDYPVPESIQLRQQLVFPSVTIDVPTEVIEAELEVVEDGADKAEGQDMEAEVEAVVEEPVEEEEEEEEEEEQAMSESGIEMEMDAEDDQYRERGWWLHNGTNLPLGGEDGIIQFTVVGLTIANSMISLTGSLLADPFSVKLVPTKAQILAAAAAVVNAKRRRMDSTESESGSEDEGADEDVDRAAAPPRLSSVLDGDATPEVVKVEPVQQPKKSLKVKEPKTKKDKKTKSSVGSGGTMKAVKVKKEEADSKKEKKLKVSSAAKKEKKTQIKAESAV